MANGRDNGLTARTPIIDKSELHTTCKCDSLNSSLVDYR